MKKTILTLSIILATCVGATHAQAIFKKYGFNKKPLTLSKGKYNEFFSNDEVVQIGTVRFNTKTNKVIQLLEEDTTKANYLSDRSSIWYSVDPLAEKYPNYSPYVYCKNNPVLYIDPDGRDWYRHDESGATVWQKGNANNIALNNQTFNNIGESYTQKVDNNTSISYNQNNATSVTSNTMKKDDWVSQFSKPFWGSTPADKACNKASDAMLSNVGASSSGMEIIVNNGGSGVAGSANGRAAGSIADMSTAIDFSNPTKVNIDYKQGSGSGDKMGDHFVVADFKRIIPAMTAVSGDIFFDSLLQCQICSINI